MIRSWLLQVLEHGTVPAIVLALAIAPINSSSWQRHDLTKPTKLRKGVLFSASTTGAMTKTERPRARHSFDEGSIPDGRADSANNGVHRGTWSNELFLR